MDDYNRGGHSKYSVKAHFVFVTKYRKKIFKHGLMNNDIKRFLHEASKKYGYNIIQMETDEDHVHILLDYHPSVSISNIVRQFKQYSTHQMWCSHREYLSSQYWKNRVLWSDGYFVCSIGQVSQNIIERYIQAQG